LDKVEKKYVRVEKVEFGY